MDLRSAHKAPEKPQPRLRLSLTGSLDPGVEDQEYDPCRRMLRPRLAHQTSDPQRSQRSSSLTPSNEVWGDGDDEEDEDEEEEEEEEEDEEEEDEEEEEEEEERQVEEDIELEEEKNKIHRKATAEKNGNLLNGMYATQLHFSQFHFLLCFYLQADIRVLWLIERLADEH